MAGLKGMKRGENKKTYLKECRRCEKPFLTKNIRSLYCCNTCKCMWLRENNLEFAEKVRQIRKKSYEKNKEIEIVRNIASRHTKRDIIHPLTIDDILYIYSRDNFTCQYCGKEKLTKSDLTIEHIIPISKGGTNELFNLCVACLSCNSKKLYNQGIKPKVMSSAN